MKEPPIPFFVFFNIFFKKTEKMYIRVFYEYYDEQTGRYGEPENVPCIKYVIVYILIADHESNVFLKIAETIEPRNTNAF